jgi:hypothetical protein
VAVMVTPPAAAHGPGLPASASGMGGRRLVPQCHCASGPAGRTVPRDRTGHPSPSRDNGPRPRLCRMMTLRWARPYVQAALSPRGALPSGPDSAPTASSSELPFSCEKRLKLPNE